jgi:hypothetical protein
MRFPPVLRFLQVLCVTCLTALTIPVSVLSAASTVILIPQQSTWKYLATASAPSASWKDIGFDDGSWPSGPGPLGFGESYIATSVPFGPDPSDKYRTTYFRRSFTVTAPESLASLSLAARYDDGFVAWLNGVEVLRRGLPAGAIGYTTLATSHEGTVYESFDLTAFKSALVAGTNLLAIEVHQTSASSSDLVWEAGLTGATGPAGSAQLTRGPYLQMVTPNQATLRWRTDLATASRVRWGVAAAALDSVIDDSIPTTEHELTIAGIAPSTRLFYSVGTQATVLAGGDALHTFESAPPPGSTGPIRVWAFGDAGRATPAQASVRDAYLAYAASRPSDLWLMMGDNAYTTGLDSEYQAGLFDMYPTLLPNLCLFPARGNHDELHPGPDNDFLELFTSPGQGQAGGFPSGTRSYYSFDHGNIHFVCLDSEGSSRLPGGPMLTWLAQDLAGTGATWIVAYWHHPPYTKGSHDSDNPADSNGQMQDMRQYVLPVLEAGGVDLVLCGHSHDYERSMLIDGHYGLSTTLTPQMILDGGDGRVDGAGPYHKPAARTAHQGTVYVVAGTAAETGGGTLDHPVMIRSLNVLGSLVLDVQGVRLDGRFLSSAGAVLDSFTIVKGGPVGIDANHADSGLRLRLEGRNPVVRDAPIAFRIPNPGPVRLSIFDPSGRRVATLVNQYLPAGDHQATWDGLTQRGLPASPGVYLVALETRRERRVIKLVRAH